MCLNLSPCSFLKQLTVEESGQGHEGEATAQIKSTEPHLREERGRGLGSTSVRKGRDGDERNLGWSSILHQPPDYPVSQVWNHKYGQGGEREEESGKESSYMVYFSNRSTEGLIGSTIF